MIPTQHNCQHSPDGWCLACVKELKTLLDEASEMSIWRPVCDAPKDGTKLRLWNGSEHVGYWCKDRPEYQMWTNGTPMLEGMSQIHGVTHWQPCSTGPGREAV